MKSLTIFSLAVMALLAAKLGISAELPTVEEALEISQATGRPIFALAGQKS